MKPRFKICLVSDTHGAGPKIGKILPAIGGCDYFVHLGDYYKDLGLYIGLIRAKVVAVRGNCDFGVDAPKEVVLPVGESRFFLTHGHGYGVKQGLYRLAARAAECGCRYALYGHTHVAGVKEICGVTLVNPGSLSCPRLGPPSYAIVEGDGEIFFPKIIAI